MSKRINSFFQPIPSKKPKPDPEATSPSSPSPTPVVSTHHSNYPMPIRNLPSHIFKPIANLERVRPPQAINNQPHLDLLYFQPFIPSPIARDLFKFLRNELPFYRVQYTIRRGPTETLINTPRYTTVFGVDETSIFIPGSQDIATTNPKPPKPIGDGNASSESTQTQTSTLTLVESRTRAPPTTLKDKTKYNHPPRPIPPCLDVLRQAVEAATADGTHYNFCLVNYYATGDDSISYHSDDERFLGPNPTIASISLGGQRDFMLKHKPVAGSDVDAGKPLKFPLNSGDMIVMRGETQANWLHSIPKRKGAQGNQGRINITFRKAVVPGGTNNYYRYNVGDGAVYRWDDLSKRMVDVKKEKETEGEKESQTVNEVKVKE